MSEKFENLGIKPEDIKALLDLYSNRQQLTTLSHNAIRMANFFSFEKTASKFIIEMELIK